MSQDIQFWVVSSHEQRWINARLPDGSVTTLHSGEMTQRDADMFIAELKIKIAMFESRFDVTLKTVFKEESNVNEIEIPAERLKILDE